MVYKYLSFSFAVVFTSFIVGIAINSWLKKTDMYDNKLSRLDFIQQDKLTKWIGVDCIKWFVINTPFKFFNPNLKLKNKVDKSDLINLRMEMTHAEISHLLGFVFVSIFAFVKFFKAEWYFGLTIMLVNVLMNLYPSLLQQQNKRRIDQLIQRKWS